ncbi:MAG: neprosin family prolyl endopeptidase [Bryobacteraceae bacterium]
MMSLTAISVVSAQDAASQSKFVPFNEFVQSVRSVQTKAVTSAARARVTDGAKVDQMRQHLLNLYDGVSVSHSFVIGAHTADCVPLTQQPTVRAMGIKDLAAPPDSSSAPATAHANDSKPVPLLEAQMPKGQSTDAFGNSLTCEAGTIPIRRVTMDEMARFGSLSEFFQKGPNGAGHPPIPGQFEAPQTATHKYAYTYQYVNNWGDNADINLWRPTVHTDIGEIFSLAQSWTIGLGSTTQTAEVGWQNYPERTGTDRSVPFIYFTADNYNKTGCYDLTCNAFVQVSNALIFGVPWAPEYYSVPDGPQWELAFTWEFYQGNWWLRYGSTWIGYYPGSIYGGGQLSRYSNLLEFGSESVGTTVWPAEGSGLWSSSGYSYAGYQRELWYFAPNTSYATFWDTLTPAEPSPACYSITGPSFDSNSGVYFYFGGPGGASCQ